MKTKFIPAIVMLLGGSVACIVAFINHYSLKDMLSVVCLALVIFLFIGVIVRLILDSFELPKESLVDDEGEVVEKQGEILDEDVDSDSLDTEEGETSRNQEA